MCLRVIISGGGTGGHIYPALAIAQGIRNRFEKSDILYVGTKEGLESDIVPKAGYFFRSIDGCGFDRKLSFNIVKTVLKSSKGFLQSMNILRSFKPDLVIGTGGYVCVPVVMAAVVMRIPTLIHEQNALPGMANRFLSRFVDLVAVTFEYSVKYFVNQNKVRVTGLPLRPDVFCINKKKSYLDFKLNPNIPVLLVFGGSRGARSINMAMLEVIQRWQHNKEIQLIHVTGKSEYDAYKKELVNRGIKLDCIENIKIVPYLYNMPEVLAVADLVVCRAGATTIAEITAMGLPSILIPYPYAAGNHQELNARILEKKGAAVVIRDAELSGKLLMEQIEKLFLSKKVMKDMAKASLKLGKPKALEDILNIVKNLVKA